MWGTATAAHQVEGNSTNNNWYNLGLHSVQPGQLLCQGSVPFQFLTLLHRYILVPRYGEVDDDAFPVGMVNLGGEPIPLGVVYDKKEAKLNIIDDDFT